MKWDVKWDVKKFGIVVLDEYEEWVLLCKVVVKWWNGIRMKFKIDFDGGGLSLVV